MRILKTLLEWLQGPRDTKPTEEMIREMQRIKRRRDKFPRLRGAVNHGPHRMAYWKHRHGLS